MDQVSLIGYGVAGLLFGLLGLLLLTGWRKLGSSSVPLLLAVWLHALWGGVLAVHSAYHLVPSDLIWLLDALRPLAWLWFLFALLQPLTAAGPGYGRTLSWVRILVLATGVVLIVPLVGNAVGMFFPTDLAGLRLIGELLLAIAGLILVEQLFRNAPPESRWNIKYLCFALGGLFAYDFYLYSDALLFQAIDPAIYSARGTIHALVAPLVVIFLVRNPSLNLELFVSRRVVFHTTALFGAGVYMLLMAVAGYYIRLWGGGWGAALQIVFLFGAAIVLLAMLFSGQIRARIKVFFNKHFFNYRYDYREEWLRLIGTLSGQHSARPLPERVIAAIAEIVDSPGGLLWIRDDRGRYDCIARLGQESGELPLLDADDPVIHFMEVRSWIVNLQELAWQPERYDDLVLPEWVDRLPHPWLLVPLLHDESLQGFLVLYEPRAAQTLNYENLDLLKTAGMQAAGYLALSQAAESLAEARQFEGFNRLSAFVIHDLKNLIAQLSLVAKNAERHKHNPAFIDDAVKTIENSVGKMNRLMAQLKSADSLTQPGESVDLVKMITSLVESRRSSRPAPTARLQATQVRVVAEPDRLSAVLGHIVQNAQDATPPDGEVEVWLRVDGDQAIVGIRDTGTGMDRAFVEQRLFRPFDSTKGLTGMGIGAYECREFVRSLGGRVEVESEPGQGTLFQLFIPMERS